MVWKIQKLSRWKSLKKKQNKNNMGEDRISKLPEQLLHHILSFLPTKCAACTSILSKRWRNVWVFSPVLDFRRWWTPPNVIDEEDFALKAKIFMNCLERMLSFHDDMPNIKKFCLDIDEDFDESWFSALISTVIQRKVEELTLTVSAFLFWGELLIIGNSKKQFTLCPCVFTYESLTVLELNMNFVLDLPESISFPRLKILRLTHITIVDGNFIQQLFSNCPVLEELKLSVCNWKDVNVLSISSPGLKFLSIEGPDLDSVVINISVPCLLSLHYFERVAKDFDLISFPSLVDAEIDLLFARSSLEMKEGYVASKFIGGLSNVKLLKMSDTTFEDFGEGSNDDYDDDSWTQDLAPQSNLFLHLKLVEFRNFQGYPNELNVVKLFLKNVSVLQSVSIISKYNYNVLIEVVEQLGLYPRASTNCVISIGRFSTLLDRFHFA